MPLLILGVILLIVGALVYQHFGSEPIIRFSAAILVLIGLLLVILAALALADGSGSVHAAVTVRAPGSL